MAEAFRRRGPARAADPSPPPSCDDGEPVDAGAAARQALERAARALQAGRLDEAERLSRLAAAIGRMAEQAAFAALPPPEPEPPADDEVVATVDQLFEATRAWAEEMLLHGVERLPAILVARAAIWRAVVLGEEAEDEDIAAAERGGWSRRLWNGEGDFYEPPTHKRLARLLWSHTLDGLPRMAQVPPD